MTLHDPSKVITGKVCPSCERQFSAGGSLASCPHDNSLLKLVTADPFIGKLVAGHYEITEVLGAGGWSVVYKARHNQINRHVAIKILHSHLVRDNEKVLRFQREAEAASGLLHPCVGTVFDYGMLPEGQPFIVMEYMEGVALSEVLEREGALALPRALRMFQQACEGLAAAHARGVVHRDIKPSNIFVTKDQQGNEHVKILDFGLAKLISPEEPQGNLTQTGETMGTPDYMSPEQCLGMQLDARTDLYTLGYVMYEALTGRQAVCGKTTFESMNLHIYDMPKPFSVVAPEKKIPDSIEAVVFKTLAKNPDDRYQSALELQQALEKAAASRSLLPPFLRSFGASVARRKARGKRHSGAGLSQWMIPAAVLLLAGTCAVKFGYLWQTNDRDHRIAHAVLDPLGQYALISSKAERAEADDDFAEAKRLWEMAESVSLALGDQSDEYNNSLNHLKIAYTKLGDQSGISRIDRRLVALESRYRKSQYGGSTSANELKMTSLSAELAARPGDKQIAEQLAKVWNDQSCLYYIAGKYAQAATLAGKALNFEEKMFGDSSIETARSLNTEGSVALRQGKAEDAIPYYDRALKIMQEVLGPDSVWAGRIHRAMADAYRVLHNYEMAESHLKDALAILKNAKGADEDYYAWACFDQGSTALDENDIPKAIEWYQRSLDTRLKLGGPGNPSAGRSLIGLATAHAAAKQYSQAESEYRQGIEWLAQSTGERDLDVAAAYNKLAALYRAENKLSQAERYFRRSLNIAIQVQPRGDTSIHAFENLVAVLKQEQKFDEAKRVTSEVNSISNTGAN